MIDLFYNVYLVIRNRFLEKTLNFISKKNKKTNLDKLIIYFGFI